MMETCERSIAGCRLVVPNEPWFILPSPNQEDYDGCCGAGESGGWRERVVPEHILGLRVSVACYIHDRWWAMCDRTLAEFRQSNRVMLDNILEINRVHGGAWLVRMARLPVIAFWGVCLGTRKALENFLR
jgi:hypothetical protein